MDFINIESPTYARPHNAAEFSNSVVAPGCVLQFWDGSKWMQKLPDGTIQPAGITPTTKLTLTAPDDLDLYAGEDAASHYWSDDDVLTVKVMLGSNVLTTSCTGFNGVNFEYNSLSHLCAGERVQVNIGSQPLNIASAMLTIQWLRGSTVKKTEHRLFNWTHIPQYFTRPAGEGNFSLKIGGSAVSAEVYYGGEWIDFPSGVLSSTYAGCSVRTKTSPAQDTIACWSDEDVDGDPFWYLT